MRRRQVANRSHRERVMTLMLSLE
ncbi:hypothetical protein OIU77_015997 [Salix suchowensis]|uniref:Uncharacterized protein n=1 Tax=Salix suchowensis TaxID=1278906 RepID=A0ABQ8ZIS6_9ROSI|nr:hypothetical protein OIU77_015997 [Salix suchowensis]